MNDMTQEQYDVTAIDMEELQGAKAVLKHRFSSMIDDFIEDTAMYIAAIETGVSGDDIDKVAKNAHPLKSSSASLGLNGLSAIAKTIELQAKAQNSVASIASFLPLLKEASDYASTKLRTLQMPPS